ncbi:MAG: hypothetical protein M3R02_10425 [Chloroflexota bacterium]|nr:hypothetical protein [Chloroflexota bacterium]
MATEIRTLTPSGDAAMQPTLTPEVIAADRETAYLLWSTVHGQNAAEAARSLGLPEPTVRSWCQRDGWRGRLALEHQEQSQRVRSVVDAALLRVVPEVIDRLYRIAMGHGDTKPVLTKDGEMVEVEQVIPPQASVNAAKELLALYNGPKTHLHQHQVQPAPVTSGSTTPGPTDHGPAPDLAGPLTRERAAAMTPAERAAWEQARRQQQTG